MRNCKRTVGGILDCSVKQLNIHITGTNKDQKQNIHITTENRDQSKKAQHTPVPVAVDPQGKGSSHSEGVN